MEKVSEARVFEGVVGPCPNQAAHTPAPVGWPDWHAWASRMSKTHRQLRCPGCGLWMIWVEKGKVVE